MNLDPAAPKNVFMVSDVMEKMHFFLQITAAADLRSAGSPL